MSALYNLEPQPTAQVLLTTTAGDILLELFAKQTPLTSRNFIQLCLDGYYNNTIFHRLVPGFVIQGGDPTGTGEGGEAIYPGGLFENEFHSRLKFNRRGLLGMANGGRENDNGSQFFLTLGATPELEGSNTMFGRVVGDTVFNVLKMGEADLEREGSERPMYPTKVTGAQILVNPFEDMVRTERKAKQTVKESRRAEEKEIKKAKKKGGKTLLSFGAEEGGEEEAPVVRKEKFNTKLVSGNGKAGPPSQSSERTVCRKASKSPTPPILKQDSHSQLPLPEDEEPGRAASCSPEPKVIDKVSSLLERTNAQIAEMKASMKRTVTAPAPERRKNSALEAMIPETSVRGRKRKTGGNVDAHSKDILDAFRARLERAAAEPLASQIVEPPINTVYPGPTNGTSETVDDEDAAVCDLHFIVNCQSCKSWDAQDAETGAEADDRGWMSHALTFEKDRLGKDLSWKKKNEEDLIVIDPREKAKDIKEEQRAKKKARLTGDAGRAWDKERDRARV